MVAQITATDTTASGNVEGSRCAKRATSPSTAAAPARTASNGTQKSGAVARSRRVKKTRMGAASKAAVRIAVRWFAASSVLYSGRVTDTCASAMRGCTVCGGRRVAVNAQAIGCGWADRASRRHIPTSTALLRAEHDFYSGAAIRGRGLRFRTRIVLVLAVIGLIPLLVLGWLSFSVNRDELERTVGGAHQATAVAAARASERWLAQSLEALHLSLAAISLDRLTPEEASTVLRIPYRQLDAVQIIVLLDEDGNALMPALVKREPDQPPLDERDLDLFARHVPLAVAIAAGTAIGPPFRARSGSARLAVALRAGDPARSPRVVAAQLSLDAMEQQMRELAQDGSVAFLVGRDGEVIAGTPGAPVSRFEQELIAAGTSSGHPLVRQLRRGDGEMWLAAFAPLGDLGWGVVVAQPASSALRPADRVRIYTLFWAAVTLVLAALLGALLSRSLAEPIRQLSIAATALTEGRYQETARVDAGGELGTFADAFNHMAREIHRRDEEIRRWNAELQQRVDRGTLELRAAQDQILRSRRLAALGSMAAGIAHELNNPLTAISGAASMLREQLGADGPQDPLLSILLEH